MREPEWIEHDGSAKCPAPYGHDVEVKRRNGATQRNCQPQDWAWYHDTYDRYNDITHYRDWTAFEQQNSAGVVPDWARKRARELLEAGDPRSDYRSLAAWIETTFARYIAAHEGPDAPKLLTEAELMQRLDDLKTGKLTIGDVVYGFRARNLIAPEPEPVDPLREAVQAAILEADRDHAEGTTWIDDFVKGLRAGGVTMEKNNG